MRRKSKAGPEKVPTDTGAVQPPKESVPATPTSVEGEGAQAGLEGEVEEGAVEEVPISAEGEEFGLEEQVPSQEPQIEQIAETPTTGEVKEEVAEQPEATTVKEEPSQEEQEIEYTCPNCNTPVTPAMTECPGCKTPLSFE